MISAIRSRSFLMKTLLCVFFLLLLSGSAAAWELSFEGHDDEIGSGEYALGQYTTIDQPYLEGGYAARQTDANNRGSITIDRAFTGSLGFSYRKSTTAYNSIVRVYFYDNNGVKYYDSGDITLTIFTWQRVELVENSPGTGVEIKVNGVSRGSSSYISNGKNTGTIKIEWVCYLANDHIDAITSSGSIISCDSSAEIHNVQYCRIGAPYPASGVSYYINLYSPDIQKVYTKTFSSSDYYNEFTIPSSYLNKVGTYTIHLYRQDDADSSTFLGMKTFDVVDSSATGEGSITLNKADYEIGDNVDFWVHLDSYSSGYKVVCDFPTAGTNFKKTVYVTSDPFLGNFTIPDISNVIGTHTVYLLNPSGKVVASVDMNVYAPGLPDIAFDKAQYERSEKAYVYYKDVKEDSTLSVYLRYGGSTVQTLSYSIEGTGSVTLNLSSLAAADSMLAVVKDSDGYSNDNDVAKIVVGTYRLTGRIYDAKTGSVINGATVNVQGTSVNSDSEGNYNLTALAGFANYSVVASGYNSISGTVAVFDLKTIHNFYLSPVITNGGTGVYGTVVSSKTDYPLVGASVEVTNTDNLKRFSTIVDSRGFYSLSNNDLAGNLSIKVSYNNYDSIVSVVLVSSGSMQNHNFRLNAVTGYEEIDPSEHTGGQDSDNPDETAEEKAYREKYGEMGKHPFDFNGDGTVENSEWKYAGERFIMLIGILAFMGFLMLINRRR